MGHPPNHHRNAQQRILLAQAAARLMAESGQRDFSAAKRKAAEQLGIHQRRNLPDNDEIETALREYLQLFHHHSQNQQLHQLRQTALKAMSLLAPFSPRLVGSVLSGSADQHTPINLHLYAESSEQLAIFLMEHNIPFNQSEQRIRYAGGGEEQRPLFSFFAGENALKLTIFPLNGQRQAPLSPIDGRPMQRASRIELEQLLEDESTGR